MRAVQSAAVDRALTCGDPALARRHLRLVAALDGVDPAAGALPVAAAALCTSAPAPRVPTAPTPAARDDDAAVRGAALAAARFDRSPDRIASAADLPIAAVRRALASV